MRKLFFWLVGICLLVSAGSFITGLFAETTQVVKEEFGARGSLKKYEWFKDASETIEEKRQTIEVYTSNIKSMKEDYKDVKRPDWDRLDKQQYNQWALEIVGLKASYNKVVKEYNSQSSKFNWSFYNTSDLPRNYTLYISN